MSEIEVVTEMPESPPAYALRPRDKNETKQDYGTPRVFLDAVERRFGRIDLDLAAHQGNRVCGQYLGPDQTIESYRDSLLVNWREHFPGQTLWLNPPFKNFAPWAKKLAEECRRRRAWALFLGLASVGSTWFREHVHGKALVMPLEPRLTFDGMPPNPKTGKVDPYPKDLMLCAYGYGVSGFEPWRWDT
jgi:phage N-6-adenine-methyltransferase